MNIDKIIVLSTAIIKNNEGSVLMLQRSLSASFSSHWQLVEGKLEDGESPAEALIREITENLD